MTAEPESGDRRPKLALISAAAAAALLCATATGRAQSLFELFSGDPAATSIEHSLDNSGYRLRGPLVRRGDVYLGDVVDPRGNGERLVIEAHTGRLVERYATRTESWREARSDDWRPRAERDIWGSPPRPQVEIPIQRPYVYYATPAADEDVGPADQPAHARQVARAAGPQSPVMIEEPRPPERPKIRIARPRPAPSPVESGVTSAAVAPTGADKAAAIEGAPTPAAQPSPAPSPKTLEADSAPPAKPAPAPSPAPSKTKAINDIPVAPLD